MPRALERPATYADLLKVPEHLVAEIVEGELFTSPRPAPRHSYAGGALHGELRSRFGRGGGAEWLLLIEPELHLGDDVLVPDVAGWRVSRMPEFPQTASIDLAPDWICEVLSPSTARLDRLRKLPRYAHHGVARVWIVDPIIKGVEIFQLNAGHYTLIDALEGNEVVHAEPFAAFELDLSLLWAPEKL